MLATVLSATLHGLAGRVIRVEVDVAPGLPGFSIVGLADAALLEARERVRGAISALNTGEPFMQDKPDSVLARSLLDFARQLDKAAAPSGAPQPAQAR